MTNPHMLAVVEHKFLWWLLGTPFAGGYVTRINEDGSITVSQSATARPSFDNLSMRVNPRYWRLVAGRNIQ